MVEFFIPLKKIPRTTHQQKAVRVVKGKPIFYEPEKLKIARATFMYEFAQHVPAIKLSGPLSLTTKWFYPTANKSVKDGQWKDTNPDTDNIVKLPKDCMTELGFWEDDGKVASELIQKFWVTESPSGIYIRIEEL